VIGKGTSPVWDPLTPSEEAENGKGQEAKTLIPRLPVMGLAIAEQRVIGVSRKGDNSRLRRQEAFLQGRVDGRGRKEGGEREEG